MAYGDGAGCASPGAAAPVQGSAEQCSPDLAEVKAAWRGLSATARAVILEVVRRDLNARRERDGQIARDAWRGVRRQRRTEGRAAR